MHQKSPKLRDEDMALKLNLKQIISTTENWLKEMLS